MIHSEQLGELATALAKAQGEFTKIPKTETNPFFRSMYAGLPQVIETASPILTKHGLSVSQHIGCDGENDTLTTMLCHSSGQFMESTMRLHLTKLDSQGLGSATTYARRYSYMSVLGLVADQDDDGNAASKTQPPAQQQQTTRRPPPQNGVGITEPQKRNVVRLLHKLDVPEEMWRSFVAQELGLPEPVSSSALTKAQAGALITRLKAEAGEADTPAYSHQGAADDDGRPFE